MNYTKDKIQFNISKKAKIWLSVILCIILAGVCTAILINRHFTLQARKQSEQSQGGGDHSSAYIDDSVDLEHSALTQVLVMLKNVGGPYQSWFGTYLDENECASKTKANLTPARFEILEAQATQMLSIMLSMGIVDADSIESNPDLSLACTNLKDMLNG